MPFISRLKEPVYSMQFFARAEHSVSLGWVVVFEASFCSSGECSGYRGESRLWSRWVLAQLIYDDQEWSTIIPWRAGSNQRPPIVVSGRTSLTVRRIRMLNSMSCRSSVYQFVRSLPGATNPRPFIGRYLVQKVLQPEDGTFTHFRGRIR